ncbi:uncharacterized protein [Pocillopora verrucosa]|uniref:uncharacterized protein isoform X1 n=1 Tax=Pocillopora verrucosa TaxID=203993 RepID=UPI00333EF7B7
MQRTLEVKDVTTETPETARIKTSEVTIEDQQGRIRALGNAGSSKTSRAFRWFYDRFIAWWLPIPNGNEDLVKISEKEMKLEHRAERLNQLEELYNSKEREIERLKVRVAALSERRVKKNQSKVEDTLSENRQSKVEEDFANFFDETRMDALEKMEKSYSFEKQIEIDIYCPRLLCLIFEAAYEKMEEARRAMFELGKEVTRGFIQLTPDEIKLITGCKRTGVSETSITYPVCLGRQESQYPVEAVDGLMMILKETAPNCNLDCLVEDVIQVVEKKWHRWQEEEELVRNCLLSHAVSHLHKPLFQEYIKASIRLTWRMVTQTPPLRLEYQSLYLQQCHKKMGYHTSPEVRTLVKGTPDQHQEEEIACYLWPGLFDGDGRCIRKGEVLCKIKGNTE